MKSFRISLAIALMLASMNFSVKAQSWEPGDQALFVVPSNTRIGIGTEAPQYPLEIVNEEYEGPTIILNSRSTGLAYIRYLGLEDIPWDVGLSGSDFWFSRSGFSDADLVITGEGRVGIGAMNPSAKLQVAGGIMIDAFNLTPPDPPFDAGYVLTTDLQGNGRWEAIPFRWEKSGNDIYYDPTAEGNVGVGTSSPGYRLDVNGTINATGMYHNGSPVGIWSISGSDLHYSGGNIGIGTATPTEALEIWGGNLLLQSDGPQGSGIRFEINALGQFGRIWSSGSLEGPGLYLSSSDDLPDISISLAGDVGIGRIEATSKLSIDGDIDISGSRLHVGTDGKIGIGTNSPDHFLDVSQEAQSDFVASIANTLPPPLSSNGLIVKIASANGIIQSWHSGGTEVMRVETPNGLSNNRLVLSGTVKAKEIIVTETIGADFVFDDDYPLLSLSEVENHIRQNRHLPDIPSAQEVEANGVSLGQMQSKLLQKIEELTLYMIELEKENEALKQRVAAIEKRKS